MSQQENLLNNEELNKGLYSINDLQKIKDDIRNYDLSAKLNTNSAHFDKLAKAINKHNGSEKVRAVTLRNIYDFEKLKYGTDYELDRDKKCIRKNYAQIECIKSFFRHHKDKPGHYSIELTLSFLEGLYFSGELTKGLKEAESAFQRFKYDSRILKHIFRFTMRSRNYAKIQSLYDECISAVTDPTAMRICNIAMFESQVRKALVGHSNNLEMLSLKISDARRYLNNIPDRECEHPQVLYWEGRYFFESWYATPIDTMNLIYALEKFNESLNTKYSWWVHYYKCVVLKLLKREYEEEAVGYKERILQLYSKNSKQPSIKMYCISTYVLLDDIDGLKDFIQKIKIDGPNDFYSSCFHHIDCLYRTDSEKGRAYKKILESILL